MCHPGTHAVVPEWCGLYALEEKRTAAGMEEGPFCGIKTVTGPLLGRGGGQAISQTKQNITESETKGTGIGPSSQLFLLLFRAVSRYGGGCETGGGQFAGWQGLTTSIDLAGQFPHQEHQ